MKRLYNRSYFFDHGIHFECQRCGACCTGDPGIIYIGKQELTRIAEYLSLQVPFFIGKYLYPIKTGYSIKEHADGRCFFYENGCTIYPVRPYQCKTFPFWFENLRSLKKWKRISKECPGMGCGPLYSKEQILEIVQSNMANGGCSSAKWVQPWPFQPGFVIRSSSAGIRTRRSKI